jgi:hypothetical protein
MGVTVVTLLNFAGLTNVAERQDRRATLQSEVANLQLQTMAWTNRVSAAVAFNRPEDLEADLTPETSPFGAWYYSDARTEAVRLVPAAGPLLDQLELPFGTLYAAADTIKQRLEAGERAAAQDAYANDFLPAAAQVVATFEDMNAEWGASDDSDRSLVTQLAGSRTKLVSSAVLAGAIGLFVVLVIAVILPKVLSPQSQRDIDGG